MSAATHHPTYEHDVDDWRRTLARYPPELRDPGPVVEERRRLRGVDVHVDRLPAPDAPLTIVVAHGGGGYGRLFTPFARLLAAGRAEVVAPDLPGYGLTRPDGPVDYADWAACVRDLAREERARTGRPVVLVGASMGGLVAYDAAAQLGDDVAGLVVTCLLDPGDRAARRVLTRVPWWGEHAPTLLRAVPAAADRLRVPLGRIAPVHAIANDPALAAAVAADPAGGANRVSVRFLRTFLGSRPVVPPEEFTACPVLLAHPGADAWTPPEVSVRFAERIAAPTEIVLLDGAGHIPVEQPGLSQLAGAATRFLDGVIGRSSP